MLFHGLRIYDNILQDVFEQFRFAQADAEHFFFLFQLLQKGRGEMKKILKKKEVFRICLREPELFEDVLQDIVVYPQSVKKHLIVYFKELTKKNMISPGSEEANADVFMTMIFGYFIHRLQLGKRVITLSEETMLKHSTEIFMKGITGRSFSLNTRSLPM